MVPALTGVAVGTVVSAMGRAFGASSCGPADPLTPLRLGGDCLSLVASMASRVGVAAGVATAFLALLATGLARTAARIREDDEVRALERGVRG